MGRVLMIKCFHVNSLEKKFWTDKMIVFIMKRM